ASTDARHSQLMRIREGICDFRDLASRFLRSEVNCRADGNRAEVVGFRYISKQHLIEPIWQSHQFVMVNLYDERNLVRVLSGDAAQHPECRRDAVTAAFNGQLHNILRIEVLRVRGERSASRMLNALVNR